MEIYIYHANVNQSQIRVAILISDRADFKARKVIRDEDGHYIMIIGSILQKDRAVLNVHGPNNRASNHVKQKLIELQGEIHESTITVVDFNIPVSDVDRSSRQKVRKDIVALSNIISQLGIINICRLTSSSNNRIHLLELT